MKRMNEVLNDLTVPEILLLPLSYFCFLSLLGARALPLYFFLLFLFAGYSPSGYGWSNPWTRIRRDPLLDGWISRGSI